MKHITPDGEIIEWTWKTPYNHDVDAEAARTATYCKDDSKTQQSFKDEQDINVIVGRVLRTGTLPDIPVPLVYGDLTTQQNYHEMLNAVAETNGLFYRLDPELRAEYKNDPGAWLQDVNDKLQAGDLAPLREMGLDMASVDAQLERLKAEADKQARDQADAAADERAAQKAAKAAKT